MLGKSAKGAGEDQAAPGTAEGSSPITEERDLVGTYLEILREQQQAQINLAKVEAYQETIAVSQVYVSYLAKLNKDGVEVGHIDSTMQYLGIACTSSAIFGGLGGLAGMAVATFGGLAIAPLAGFGALLVILGIQLAGERK